VNSRQRTQEQRRRHPPPFSQQTDYLLHSRDSSESGLIEYLDSSRDSSDESVIQDDYPVSHFVPPTKSPFHSKWSVPTSLPSSISQPEFQSGASLEPGAASLPTSQVVKEIYQDGCRQFEMERLRIGGVILHSALLSGKQMVRTDYLCCCDPFNNKETAKLIDVRKGEDCEL
jgi:hypothetical protein